MCWTTFTHLESNPLMGIAGQGDGMITIKLDDFVATHQKSVNQGQACTTVPWKQWKFHRKFTRIRQVFLPTNK